jgi:hypothetical protein
LLGHKELASKQPVSQESEKKGDEFPPSDVRPEDPEIAGWLEKFFAKLKLWFEAEPDIDINVKKPVN